MKNRHIKTFNNIREKQITMMIYHLILNRITIIKKRENVGKDVGKLEPSSTAGENVK